MEGHQIYTREEVKDLVSLYLDGAERDKLDPILDVCAARYKNDLTEDEQIAFKGAAKIFTRTYGFLGAILPYGNADWERLSIFLNLLLPKLPSPDDPDLAKGILESVDLDSYRLEAQTTMAIQMEDENAEIGPVPTGKAGGKPETELDVLTRILNSFNEIFGNTQWVDADRVRKKVAEIPAMVSQDEKYQNAMKNSDKQNARIESERALSKVMFGVMADDMELYKQFTDNPSFKKWLSDMVFSVTYNTEGHPPTQAVTAATLGVE